MGQVMTEAEYRPTLSAEMYHLRRWYTPRRLEIAWTLAKGIRQREGETAPAASLIWDIGVSSRSMYRWIHGRATPSTLSLHRLDLIFSDVIGEQWRESVRNIEQLDLT